MNRRQRYLLLVCAAIVLAMALCAATTTVEGKSASKSAPASSSSSDSDAARAIRERAALRDQKIAAKKAEKARLQAEKEQAEKEEKKRSEATAAAAKKKKAADQQAKKDAQKESQSAADAAAKLAAARQETARAEAEAAAKARSKAASTPEGKAAAARRQARLEKAQKRAVELKQQRQARKKRRLERISQRRKKEDARRRARLEAAKPEIVARGKEKLKWMESSLASAKKSGRVIRIKYSDLQKYVHASPRPYWLFVAFTALADRYTCSICRTVAPEMKKLASVYYTDKLQREAANASAVVKTEKDFATEAEFDAWRKDQMPIFFVEVDIETNGEAFRILNMQSAPTMVVLPPTAASSPPAMSHMLTSLPSKNRYQLTKADISAVDLNEFIQKATGRTVSLATTREPGLAGLVSVVSNLLNLMDPVRYLLLCVAAGMLCLLAALWTLQSLYRAARRFQSSQSRARGIVTRELSASELAPVRVYSQYSQDLLVQSLGTPSLSRSCFGVVSPGAFRKPRALGLFRWWFICVGCLVYLFGISGGMFNILRGNSAYNFDFLWSPTKFDIWRHIQKGDSHDQSVTEGLMLGVLQLTLATIIIFLNRVSFTTRTIQIKTTQSGTGATTTTTASDPTAKERLVSVGRWLLSCLYSPLIWATLAFLTWRLIIAIYTAKNGGYRHGFVWQHIRPEHFHFIKKYAAAVLKYAPKVVTQAVYRWF